MSQNTTQPYNLPPLPPQQIKVTTTPPRPVSNRPNPSVVTSQNGGSFYSKNTKIQKSRRRKSKRFQSRRRNRGRK